MRPSIWVNSVHNLAKCYVSYDIPPATSRYLTAAMIYRGSVSSREVSALSLLISKQLTRYFSRLQYVSMSIGNMHSHDTVIRPLLQIYSARIRPSS